VDPEKRALLREINQFFEEYDKRFPEWYRRLREKARKIYWEYEEKGLPVGRYGLDFDLTQFYPHLVTPHPPLRSLRDLDEVGRRMMERVGNRPDEEARAASHLQHDTVTRYAGLTELGREQVLLMHPRGLVVEDFDEAICKYPWLEKYVGRILPVNLDKYTAWNTAYSRGGIFVWVKRGVSVKWPLQSCFYLERTRLGQLVRIFIYAEPHSEVHLISGCVFNPGCETALHGCITEVYVGREAEVTLTMIHHFKPRFHIRPKVGVIVDDGGIYRSNYILTSPVESAQLYPTVILRGSGSRASMRSLLFGLGSSDLDIGSAIMFTGSGSRGEVISRAVVAEAARVKLRGALKAYRPDVRGHIDCRALLLSRRARAHAYPNLKSMSPGARLTHEAAIGRIEEEHILYLMSRGLDRDEATSMIVRGFLDIEIPGLPDVLKMEIGRLIKATAEKVM